MTADGHRHLADGARAGDQHVLTDEIERERGVHRVAERVEDGGDVVGNVVGERVDVGSRQHDVVGERTVAVDADSRGGAAEVMSAGPAVTTCAAHDVALAGHPLADGHRRHLCAHRIDGAEELVAYDDGR